MKPVFDISLVLEKHFSVPSNHWGAADARHFCAFVLAGAVLNWLLVFCGVFYEATQLMLAFADSVWFELLLGLSVASVLLLSPLFTRHLLRLFKCVAGEPMTFIIGNADLAYQAPAVRGVPQRVHGTRAPPF